MGAWVHSRPVEYGRVVRITLQGDLDLYRRGEVVAALPRPQTVDRLIVDCSRVTSLDSSIMAVLMHYRRDFLNAGHDAANLVVIVNPSIRRFFEIVGLQSFLTLVTTASHGETSTADVRDVETSGEQPEPA